jgi:hypothetical protein
MKKFLTLLTLLIMLPALSATAQVWQHEDPIPGFTYNHKSLTKPAEINSAQWIDVLEVERDKADALVTFEAFKYYTKEIAKALAGKYGDVETSPAKLIYSVIRTRHKFSGKRNILVDFYGVTETTTITPQQTTILAVDTMIAKSMNSDDETFETQWAAVNAENSASPEFNEAIKKYAQTYEQKSWNSALAESLEQFLETNQPIVTLTKKIFDIFAPKLTLNKIYGDMAASATYKGWTIHGAIAYPIVFTAEEKANYAWLETALNKRAFELIANNIPVDIHCRSAMADFASEAILSQLGLTTNTVILSYIYDPATSEMTETHVNGMGILRLFFTREADPELVEILRRPLAKAPETQIRKIYTMTMREAAKRRPQQTSSDEVTFLKNIGNPTMQKHISAWHFHAKHGFEANIAKAIEFCREAADLGNKEAEYNLPIMLYEYASRLYLGKFTAKNEQQGINFCEEAAILGNQNARANLPIMLYNSAVGLLQKQPQTNSLKQQAIELLRKSANLGHADSIQIISSLAASS